MMNNENLYFIWYLFYYRFSGLFYCGDLGVGSLMIEI